jgi:hypothetical protein
MLRKFILNADGSVSLSTEKPAAQSKLAVILEVLQRRTYAAEEVMPLISTEIARAKSNMEAQKNSSELQKLRRFLSSLYLVKDYVERTSAPDPFGQKFDRTELKNIEGEVFRFLKEVAFRDDRLMEVDVEQASRTKTFGEVSPKYMIELISDGMPIGSFKLLLWDGTQSFIQDQVGLKLKPGSDSGAIILEPPNVDPTVRKAIRFPTSDAPFCSTQQLFTDICTLVKKYTALSPKLVSLTAYSVLASWFSDFTPVPVCVSIVGPHSHKRSNLFRLLSCLYRRPLLLGEMSAAVISSLPMELCPALFVEGYEFSRQLQRVLRASSARNIYFPRKGRLINTCCAKVICSEELLDNQELGQGTIEIPVTRTSLPIPILEKCAQQEIACEFQSRLLRFRLASYNAVRNSSFDVPDFEPSVRDLARCLGACVSEDPELQKDITPLLTERNQEFDADSECSMYVNRIVIGSVFFLCHQEKKHHLHVKEITIEVNSNLRRRGEMIAVTPKQVGNKLRALGLTTKRLDAYGRGIELLGPVRRRIHSLAWNYKVGSFGDPPEWHDIIPYCPDCAWVSTPAKLISPDSPSPDIADIY